MCKTEFLNAWCLAIGLLLATTPNMASASDGFGGIDSNAVLGGALGGGAGAAVGSAVGGRNGAIVGGALGAATGVAIATPRQRVSYGYREADWDDHEHHDNGWHRGHRHHHHDD